jgi:tRNA modification GTPase
VPDEPRDTIAAIATPPGRGGIGILRLSGPDALTIAAPLLRLRSPLEPARARFCEIVDPTDQTTGSPATKLDEAIATYFQAPRSYTGEDVVEIAAHGSPVLLDFLLRQTIAHGARLANPGEFTERAFLAGRLDLTQAEAVRDLIDAQTLYQARVAASQLDGALSRRVAPIKAALIQLIAQLEAGIDFAEDDTPTLSTADFLRHADPIAGQLATLAHSFEHGRLVHSGLTLAIIGEPNVGKSSLFNRLVERERAIVTAAPGTTRDLVTERVAFAGIPVELIDTAGLRPPIDEAERLGIEKSREALADADLVLLVLDAAKPLSPESAAGPLFPAEASLDLLQTRRVIVILNKCDLIAFAPLTANPGGPDGTKQLQLQIEKALPDAPLVLTSAQSGQGLPTLRATIQKQLERPSDAQEGMLTNLRQHQSVAGAHAALLSALASAPARVPDEMLLLDLYTALRHLDALTGQTTSDDILNLIFSTFCIGK